MRDRLIGFALLGGGLVVCLLIIAAPHMIVSNVINEFKFGMAIFKMVQVEPNTDRLIRYVREFFYQLLSSGLLFVPAAYLSILVKSRNVSRYIVAAVVCAILLVYVLSPEAFSLSSWVGVSTSLSAVLALTLVLAIRVWTKDLNAVVLTVGMLILPYCIAFGTGNNISTQILISLASWGTTIAILTVSAKPNDINNGITTILCGCFVSIVAFQVALSSFSPYHLNTSIWSQAIPIKVGEVGNVKVDEATYEFVSSLTDAAHKCNISDGRPYLGLYEMPGVALVIRAIPVFSPWLTNPAQSDAILNRINPDDLRSVIIGIRLNEDGTIPSLPKHFKNFPDGYEKCGEATYPYLSQKIQLWVSY